MVTKKTTRKKPVLKEVEIVASYSGTISSGRFENEKPFYSLKEVWTGEPDNDFIVERQGVLQKMCYSRFAEVEKKSLVEKILKQRADLRFYQVGTNQYPSVTSVIGWDDDFFIDQMELTQYASRGTILHKQVELFLQSGKWVDPKDLPEVAADYVIVKKGSLGLALDDVDFQAYYKAHPFETILTEQKFINNTHRYAGRNDVKALYKGVVTLFDVKTGATVNKAKAFKQLAAYANCEGNEDVGQIGVIHLTNKNKCGFAKPIIDDNIERYFNLFLNDRKVFEQRFGL